MAETTETNSITLTTGNEIGKAGKIIAGILFILFKTLIIVTIIAYWPDRLPKTDNGAVYRNTPFNVCLLDSMNHCDTCFQTAKLTQADTAEVRNTTQRLIGVSASIDSAANIRRKADSIRITDSLYKARVKTHFSESCCKNTIKLNTLLLILIALAGFLGTLIHTASSFTNFVGSEKFKRSWILWYIVKPFTGSALALVLYFVFRAGLLNFNDTSNINLYGIVTLAALAGLFTDKATLKLEEVFAVLFKPKDERPDKLDKDVINVKITGIKPEALLANTVNQLVISGEGFDKKKLIIKIGEEEIKNPVIKNDSISFSYKVPEGSDQNEFVLHVYDESGKEIYTSKLLKQSPATNTGVPPVTNTKPNDENQNEFGNPDAPDNTNSPKD